jgi:hypothetical protein
MPRECLPTSKDDSDDFHFSTSTILGPLILTADLLLLLGGEVVRNVERLADLLGGLALDHVRNGLAANVKEGLDVEVVGGL